MSVTIQPAAGIGRVPGTILGHLLHLAEHQAPKSDSFQSQGSPPGISCIQGWVYTFVRLR